MSSVVLRIETELDPAAMPRIFGYLGGLGHVPLQALLRRNGSETLVVEVRIEAAVPVAERISAKLEQMPFVLTAVLAIAAATSSEGAAGAASDSSGGGIPKLEVTGGMQHAPIEHAAVLSARCSSRFDASALRLAATQRMHAIQHRYKMQFNA